jgi:hypothetical protein
MAYSFFPNDFQNLPNLQDQLFLMKQKQATALNEYFAGTEKAREAHDAIPRPKLNLSSEFIASIPPAKQPVGKEADSKTDVKEPTGVNTPSKLLIAGAKKKEEADKATPNSGKIEFTPSPKERKEYSHTVFPWQRVKTVGEAGEGYKGRKAQDDYMDEDESKLSPEVKADKQRYLRLKAEKEQRRLNTPVNQQNRYAFGGSDPADKDIDEYKKYDVYRPVYEPKVIN